MLPPDDTTPERVYRIVFRVRGSDDEWMPVVKRLAHGVPRLYVTKGTATGALKSLLREQDSYERQEKRRKEFRGEEYVPTAGYEYRVESTDLLTWTEFDDSRRHGLRGHRST